MHKVHRSLCPTEATLLIQSRIEGLDPQQVLARDLLVKAGFVSFSEATELVTGLGAEKSAELKQRLQTRGTAREDLDRFLSQPIQVPA
jgi:hypothetical protein